MTLSLSTCRHGLTSQWAPRAMLFFLVLVCVVLPFRRPQSGVFSGVKANFPGWRAVPLSLSNLKLMPLDAKTQQFAAEFPGKIGVFSDGHKTRIVRWVLQPTRKLHPSSDCLRAAGYRIQPTRA